MQSMDAVRGLLWYASTIVLLILVTVACNQMLPSSKMGIPSGQGRFSNKLVASEGRFYADIVEHGYSISGDTPTINFFPAYPLIARVFAAVFRLSADTALVLVSHLFFCCSCIAMSSYASDSRRLDPAVSANLALLAMVLCPITLCFRLAYSESMFLFLALLVMHGINRCWPAVVIAIVIGLATATRSVGVALLGPFILYLYCRPRTYVPFAAKLAYYIPLCCWGILSFMVYQYVKFGDPLAFAKAQLSFGRTSSSLDMYILDPLSWQPIVDTYDPKCECYWANVPPRRPFVFNIGFASPVYFGLTAFLICLGRWNRWITSGEFLLSLLLLSIPYFTVASRMCMWSHWRYCSVIFPVYFVLAALMARHCVGWTVAFALVGTSLLSIYTAQVLRMYPSF